MGLLRIYSCSQTCGEQYESGQGDDEVVLEVHDKLARRNRSNNTFVYFDSLDIEFGNLGLANRKKILRISDSKFQDNLSSGEKFES